ncbi:MAG: hypothetical protein V2A34_03805 [Lentisphaerota bacterium]
MKKLAIALALICSCGQVQAVNTLKVHNDVPLSVADPTNVFIQLMYASASIHPALPNYAVVYPFTSSTSVWTLVITNIDAGNLKFGLDPTREMTQFTNMAPDVRTMFTGLFEFSLLSGDTVGYWDLSNVDWIGMLCGAVCTTGGYPEATWHIGYNKKASELISMITNEYQFTAEQAANVLVTSNAWSNTWVKLMAPNKNPVEYASSPSGTSNLVNYLYRLESNNVPVLFKANFPSLDTNWFSAPNPVNWTSRMTRAHYFSGGTNAPFTGHFQPAAPVTLAPTGGPGTNYYVVLILTNHETLTELYYATNAINPSTIYQNESDGGLWVRYCTDTNAGGTWEWVMTNRHLNCVTPHTSNSAPSLFEDWVASLANRLCFSMNAGLIPTNSNPAQVFTISGNAALVAMETNTWQSPRYKVNTYNAVIVENSDSYGMAYSDANTEKGAKVVVQTRTNGAIVELHILSPNADPSEYYSKHSSSGTFHAITASAGAHGTILPSGVVSVSNGNDQVFVITATNLYRIQEVTTNTVPVPAVFDNDSVTYTHTWQNVQADGQFAAAFTAQLATNTPVAVPKPWLAQYYPATNDYENAALGDTDGDRMEAWREYVANTDPTNSDSVLTLRDLVPEPGSSVAITVATEPSRIYTIYFADQLAGPTPWMAFANPAFGRWTETNPVSTLHTFIDDFSADASGGEPAGGARSYNVDVNIP